jgi:hypothetical protein
MSATVDEKVDQLRADLGELELKVMTEGPTLASLIRCGTRVTAQARNWGDGDTACTLSAAFLAARALGVVDENKTTEGK